MAQLRCRRRLLSMMAAHAVGGLFTPMKSRVLLLTALVIYLFGCGSPSAAPVQTTEGKEALKTLTPSSSKEEVAEAIRKNGRAMRPNMIPPNQNDIRSRVQNSGN